MIGKMCIATAFAVAYNYSAEIFPTVVRNAGIGFAGMCAMIGSIAAPQIHLLVCLCLNDLYVTTAAKQIIGNFQIMIRKAT